MGEEEWAKGRREGVGMGREREIDRKGEGIGMYGEM